MGTLLPQSERAPSQSDAQGCSAMAEEPLGVVEFEGLQAQGTPGRGEEGEAVTHRDQEQPMAPTEKAQSLGYCPAVGADSLRTGFQAGFRDQQCHQSPCQHPEPPASSHLTRRRHIFSWGNSLGPSTLGSWGSVSRYTSSTMHRRCSWLVRSW